MGGENLHFNAPGSVFSQINGSGNTNPSMSGTMSTDTTGQTNSQISGTEAQSDKNNADYKKVRSEYKDPATSSNKELNAVKNPQPVKAPDTRDIESSTDIKTEQKGTEISGKVNVKKKENPRSSGDTEQGWIETEAMSRINSSMSDSTSNIKENQPADARDTDTSLQKSKKPGVGKVPSIDQQRPSPKQPNTNYPKHEYTSPKSISPKTPSLQAPKFSIPRMKLR